MSFEKRVCVLRQIKKGFTADGSALSGAVYAERMGNELTLVPRLLGIAPVREGRYALALWIDGGKFIAELSGIASIRMEAPSIKAGFAVLLVYLRGEAEPVAFGSCGVAPTDYADLLAFVTEQRKKVPAPLPPNELPYSPPNVPLAPSVPLPGEAPPFRTPPEKYDDEAIAAKNYFNGQGDDDEPPACGGSLAEQAQADGAPPCEDARPVPLFPHSLTYYHTVREKLAEAFQKYPKDTRLLSAFPLSEWVKTDSALLGIIYREGSPAYLCVAVEANGDPPEEMKGRCCFVPGDFSEKDGFFVVFQSADSGEYVTVSSD